MVCNSNFESPAEFQFNQKITSRNIFGGVDNISVRGKKYFCTWQKSEQRQFPKYTFMKWGKVLFLDKGYLISKIVLFINLLKYIDIDTDLSILPCLFCQVYGNIRLLRKYSDIFWFRRGIRTLFLQFTPHFLIFQVHRDFLLSFNIWHLKIYITITL